MTDREPGFYWVKIIGNWMIGRWDGHDWALHAIRHPWLESDIQIIGPRIEKPENLK